MLDRVADFETMTLAYGTLPADTDLRTTLGDLLVDRACDLEEGPVRDEAAFEAHLATGRRGLLSTAEEVVPLVRQILTAYQDVARKLMLTPPPGWENPVEDMIKQVARLMRPGFLTSTPFAQLRAYPRYLKAIDVRLRKLGAGSRARDDQNMALVSPHWQACLARQARNEAEGLLDPELESYRWLIEEYRVSLFAQELGTAHPVSEKRLARQWEKVR